jgi:SAM-dependent methyltransferase
MHAQASAFADAPSGKDLAMPSAADHPTPEHLLQLGFGFWASKTLLSGVELGLFSALAGGPKDCEALSSGLGLHQRSARDFLDALVALKVLERDDGLYRNTPAADLYLDKGKPSYMGGILEMANARLYGFWGSLTEALRTGDPQNEAKRNEDFFGALYADPQRLRGFLQAMSGISAGSAMAIAEAFPWQDVTTVADVGCAQGMVPVTLARRHPHLKATGFDLAPVRPVFEDFVARQGLSDRVRFQAGNFFDDPMPDAEVIVMGHILHDWDLAQKRLLVRSAYEALPRGGALIVYDAMIDDDRRENAMGLLMSLNMLIETPGGYDYTGRECIGWLEEAGFRDIRQQHLVGPESMVAGWKR